MSMLIKDVYPSDEELINKQLEDCCKKESSATLHGIDCCYDDWRIKSRDVSSKFDKVVEEAKLAKEKLNVAIDRRDRIKKWLDELILADDMAHNTCNQIDQLINQLNNIHKSIEKSVASITILYCMIKDLYSQLDEIKVKYDYIMNCIKCLDNPVFESGKGLLKCLDDYDAAYKEVINTRDSLIKLILSAIDLVEQLYMNIGDEYGIANILVYWKKIFNCNVVIDSVDTDPKGAHDESEKKQGKQTTTNSTKENECIITPKLSMPIYKDDYYIKLKKLHEEETNKVRELTEDYTTKNKEKERLQACKKSLEDGLKEVDPTNRCKE